MRHVYPYTCTMRHNFFEYARFMYLLPEAGQLASLSISAHCLESTQIALATESRTPSCKCWGFRPQVANQRGQTHKPSRAVHTNTTRISPLNGYSDVAITVQADRCQFARLVASYSIRLHHGGLRTVSTETLLGSCSRVKGLRVSLALQCRLSHCARSTWDKTYRKLVHIKFY